MRVNCECGGKAYVYRSEQVTDRLRRGAAQCTECGQHFAFTLEFERVINAPVDRTLPELMRRIQSMSPAMRKSVLARISDIQEKQDKIEPKAKQHSLF
jgi:hypothetical protein